MAAAEPSVAGEPSAGAGLTLVSGPCRSGKSRWAEHLAGLRGVPVLYLATGPCLPEDPGWCRRLDRHRRRRPASWATWEVQGGLSEALLRAPAGHVLLIDSLGTWLSHHLELEREEWDSCERKFLEALHRCRSESLIVCEEAGWGVVPPTAIGCRFRDRLGTLQQRLHQRCDAAWLVVHGRALDLLQLGQVVPDS